MSKINIQGIVDQIKSQTSPYSPIIEAVVNSIDSIIESNKSDGLITISIDRFNELNLENDEGTIRQIRIRDNGIGFNTANADAFDTFRTYNKRNEGGKGFGRFLYLKYFSHVSIDSVFIEEGNAKSRSFRFGRQFKIIENEKVKVAKNSTDTYAELTLSGLKDINQIDKTVETITRNILERLLPFFIDTKFICPRIEVVDTKSNAKIVLNEYLSNGDRIKEINDGTFDVSDHGNSRNHRRFKIKVFKIYFAGNRTSKIHLIAHLRSVTETSMSKHIPEFQEDFFDVKNSASDNPTRENYILKAYVSGPYLDENVELERETFEFHKEHPNMMYPVSRKMIEKEAAQYVKGLFPENLGRRYDKKVKKVRDYVNTMAPWHKSYVSDVDFADLPYDPTAEAIETTLQKHKFHEEVSNRVELNNIIYNTDYVDSDKLNKIVESITDLAKSDLVHYVVSRKLLLDTFQSLLKRSDEGKASLENQLHKLIFPMNADTESTNYNDHNLWILDERLSFSIYAASDRKIGRQSAKEPDLVVFDKKRAYRSGENEYSNPLTIFEFKRPKRNDYSAGDDPVLQLGKYIKEIRDGKYEVPDGVEIIKVNDNTPVYGYIIADLTPKIKEFAMNHSLTMSPDGEGYFGYHGGYKMYLEIVSFRKVLSDAKLRNKIFFKKLNID